MAASAYGSIEVVSYHDLASTQEVSKTAFAQYGLMHKNREFLDRYGIKLFEFYPTFNDYLLDIMASINSEPVPSQKDANVFCDFNTIYLNRQVGRVMIGGVDVTFARNVPRKRTIGYYGAEDYQGKSLYSVAVSQVVDRLAIDPDIDMLEAYVDSENTRSVALLNRIGFQGEELPEEDSRHRCLKLDIRS